MIRTDNAHVQSKVGDVLDVLVVTRRELEAELEHIRMTQLDDEVQRLQSRAL